MYMSQCSKQSDKTESNLLDETDVDIDVDDVDVDVDVVVDEVTTQKRHFLDYDSVPSPEFTENFAHSLNLTQTKVPTESSISQSQTTTAGEQLKMDKKYERDGEVSDYELAACGYTKKEFTQDDNTLHLSSVKPKHFLDENPIPPDYMLPQPHADVNAQTKSNLQRDEPSYTLSSFLDSESKAASLHPAFQRLESLQMSLQASTTTLGSKVECVYSLLSMLGSNDPLEMSKKFLELSRSPETCATLRRSGCIPLLVQMVYSEGDENVRKCANAALHNVVHSAHIEDKVRARREAKILRLLDQIVEYCNFLKTLLQSGGEAIADDSERHPLSAIASLMKVSFDEEHREAMVELGALHAIPNLVQLDHAVHGPKPEEQCCNSLRRYGLMALTNLTFGDEHSKALLCSQKTFMEALVSQLDAAPDDLLQVTASVLRNLSWRADSNMKAVLNEIGTVTALVRAAMKNKCENTLKAILSALWNLSAHCSTNKAEFCAVDGALAFVVDMLSYEGPSKTLKIIENAGGILRNVSSHIAVREHYRQILRERNCLSILLQQLKSESLTVVSNSCGTLWNLSARCPEDQKFLWDNGAVPMLRSLIHSKHAMISEGSASALKNLLNFRPSLQHNNQLDPIARSMGLKELPTLNVRKQKALAQELGEHNKLPETCENIDANIKITNDFKERSARLGPLAAMDVVVPSHNARLTRSAMLTKSESRDSVFSVKSDTAYEHIMRSHSASDANRTKSKQNTAKYAAAFGNRTPFVALDDNEAEEPNEEQPVNYSMKYAENATKTTKHINTVPVKEEKMSATYQETDLDQPTDFSLRYAENQIESDIDVTPPEGNESAKTGNEILLILDDSVKCYQTEDTPYVISNAASITDLRQAAIAAGPTSTIMSNKTKGTESVLSTIATPTSIEQVRRPHLGKKCAMRRHDEQTNNVVYGSGTYTPEKPVNYCEEGTPGYFSRYESLSSLDESMAAIRKEEIQQSKKEHTKILEIETAPINSITTTKHEPLDLRTMNDESKKNLNNSKPASMLNSAQETPLMFSRHSSMDSLVEADVGPLDDKSSIISDYSRLASGVISPSELPDSPTQSMPQSPKRQSASRPALTVECKKPLRSVFEDNLNQFHVENTPAQFSTATSLSNLSILDDELTNLENTTAKHNVMNSNNNTNNIDDDGNENNSSALEEKEEEDDEELEHNNQDDLLLANCINMGMNRIEVGNKSKQANKSSRLPADEEIKRYCTEDTPALRSKVGSNTNLSVISICSSDMKQNVETEEHKDNIEVEVKSKQEQRLSMNLSDDVSSNASESGAAADILQQCIRDGMQKAVPQQTSTSNAISMLRCGASGPLSLPSYLPVNDEIGKYVVEDSPCNFSLMSGLSNLTVGSSLVGPAVQLKTANKSAVKNCKHVESKKSQLSTVDSENTTNAAWHDDSLSSLSIDSEDDTNLLSQAIAAGCSRPKSNLGFSTNSHISKRNLTALSASQPLPTGSSSLSQLASTRHKHGKQHHSSKQQKNMHLNGNESYSSVDSSDSNDNQSKSLFELCILTGMQNLSTGRDLGGSSGSNNSRKQALLSNSSRNRNAALGVGVGASAHDIQAMSNRLQKPHQQHHGHKLQHQQQQQPIQQHTSTLTPNRHMRERESERERKDEKLLMECINTGISKKINKEMRGNQQQSAPVMLQQQPVQQQQQLMFAQNVLMPKNVQATSAAVLEHTHQMEDITYKNVHSTVAATGVEKSNICNNNKPIYNNSSVQYNIHYNSNSSSSNNNNNINHVDIITDVAKNLQVELQQQQSQQQQAVAAHIMYDALPNQEIAHMTMNDTGSNNEDEETQTGSDDSANISYILEPKALHLSNFSQPIEPSSVSVISEKHKNPDLMLKSVERLTLEFVSSAERCNNARKGSTYNSGTNSHNTWNESIADNDVSFPSVSISAPVISSLEVSESECSKHTELHDFAETTPTNEHEQQIYESGTFVGQPISLDAESLTLQNSVVDFDVGGEVKTAAVLQPNLQMFGNSVMSKSTMIAIEARALAADLQQVECQSDENSLDLTFSIQSLDLDNVCPPSDMESMNISEFYHEPAPQLLATKSPKFPRKALPVGLMARRALGHLTGSAESVNSSCNMLDNIKPPSLMDDLLDSMISVASIQSEVADCDSLASTVSLTHFETAGLEVDFDDNTVTMQSCLTDNLTLEADKQTDSDSASTPLPSDNSSATSTPKHKGVKRTLTPKQKRKVAQDRFKTYTIAADMVMNEEHFCQVENHTEPDQNEDDITLQINMLTPPSENVSPRKAFNRRRSEAQDRYKTQTIIYNGNETSTDIATTDVNSLTSTDDDPQSEEISSIRALTARFEYLKAEQIIEPVKIEETAVVEDVKVVRGRKKIAYVSPYSKQAQKQTSSNTRATIAKPVQNGNKRLPVVKTTAAKKTTSSTTNVASVKPIERQGTFVQEEPTIDTATVPIVECTSAAVRASKLPTKRVNTTTTPVTRKINTNSTTSNTKCATTVRRSSAGTPQRSNSNANIRLATQSARVAMVNARGFTTTPPSRSNSTLNSNNSSTLKIQQAQSRIASIWKRVDEVKNKPLQPQQQQTAKHTPQAKRTMITPKIPIQSKIAVNRSNLTTPNRNNV